MMRPFLGLPDARDTVLRGALAPRCLLPHGTDAIQAQHDGLLRVDMLVRDGVIAAIGATLDCDDLAVPLNGEVILLPAFHDIHTHLDKGHIWARTPNADGSFNAALAATQSDRERFWDRDDMERRAEFALRPAFAHGTAGLRTHLDTFGTHRDVVWPLFREMQVPPEPPQMKPPTVAVRLVDG